MADESLRLHHFLPQSRANGPGLRAVVWVQGCTLGCPGCFNPQTHSKQDGTSISVNDLADQILALKDEIEGVTISGGEPFQQLLPVLALIKRIRAESNLSILVFTGYTWAEIQKFAALDEIKAGIEVLITGRYDHSQPASNGLISSVSQQPVFNSNRYTPEDLGAVPPLEAILMPNGEVVISGVGGIQSPPQGKDFLSG